MNKVLVLTLTYLLGCSYRPTQTNDLLYANLREINASSLMESQHIILNHQRYLRELFRQTRDPYYNKNKWSDDCLNENIIGEVQKLESNPFLTSILYLDQSLQPGVCSGERFHVIMIYCPKLAAVREIKINLSDKSTLVNERLLCL